MVITVICMVTCVRVAAVAVTINIAREFAVSLAIFDEPQRVAVMFPFYGALCFCRRDLSNFCVALVIAVVAEVSVSVCWFSVHTLLYLSIHPGG